MDQHNNSPDPAARSYLIDRLPKRNVDPWSIADRLGKEKDPSALRALILSLGTYELPNLDDNLQTALIKVMLLFYDKNDDAGVHAAARWASRPGARVYSIGFRVARTLP